MQPGSVIGPGGQEPPAQPETNAPQPPVESPQPPVEVPQEVESPPSPEPAPEVPKAEWEFHEEAPSADTKNPATHEPVSWTASEYVAHDKSLGWYLTLGLVIVGAAVVVYLLTKELISSVVIVIMGIAFGAFAARKPQELEYLLDNNGLKVGNRLYPYTQFKSFNVLEEESIHSIMLIPLQRFMPPLSVYYAPEDEDKIADALSSYLPFQERKPDVVDRVMRRVRF
jgi:hypothetical protein